MLTCHLMAQGTACVLHGWMQDPALLSLQFPVATFEPQDRSGHALQAAAVTPLSR